MKRMLIIISMLISALTVSAQETNTYRDKAPHFYCTTEFNMSGGDMQGWGKPDFGIMGIGVYPGWRFNQKWSVFVPVSADYVLLNRQSTRNFVEQGTLGLGGSYQLNMKNHAALEFRLQGASTYIRSDIDYFKAKASVNFGIHGVGSSPFIGIGCSYFSPYDTAMKDKVMLELSIGMQLF